MRNVYRDKELKLISDNTALDKCLQPGPEVIKLFSCSTQPSMKLHLVIKKKIPKFKTFFMLNSAELAQPS